MSDEDNGSGVTFTTTIIDTKPEPKLKPKKPVDNAEKLYDDLEKLLDLYAEGVRIGNIQSAHTTHKALLNRYKKLFL